LKVSWLQHLLFFFFFWLYADLKSKKKTKQKGYQPVYQKAGSWERSEHGRSQKHNQCISTNKLIVALSNLYSTSILYIALPKKKKNKGRTCFDQDQAFTMH
jgi:hypothetical protein